MLSDELPRNVRDLYAMPTVEARLYRYVEPGFYHLSEGGQALAFVRQALRADASISEAKARKFYAKVALPDWSAAMSAANTSERRELLKLAAAGRVKIEKETAA